MLDHRSLTRSSFCIFLVLQTVHTLRKTAQVGLKPFLFKAILLTRPTVSEVAAASAVSHHEEVVAILAQAISLKVALLTRVHLFVVFSQFFCIHVRRPWDAEDGRPSWCRKVWFNVIRGPRPPSVRWPQAECSRQPEKVVRNSSAATPAEVVDLSNLGTMA